ncbi:farnesol dehydrogenase-like [Ctenocephalides felis]|uniref:farnesol dehydrogenase-like n=1 Tax=Ctenocephalides felis TaxID=7515 RepID=UPI000E6E21D3|nr:farnesol dehydrogenase-like [Ctenocephalides felis]
MERWRGKVAVVTGASAGIGEAITKDLVEAGLTVVGLARRKEKMEENAQSMNLKNGGKFYARKCDVSKEQDILDTFSWIKENLGGVDVLVNNAGIVRMNMLTNSGNSDDLRSVLDVNVLGLCFCTREAFNSMKERDVAGHIFHINSVVGHSIPLVPNVPPTMNMYPGSKHCVTALTETLRQEMMYLKSKTKITSISPGVVLTEIFDAAMDEEKKQEFLKYNPYLNPEDISQAVLYCLSTPEHVQVHELTIKPVGEKF